MSLEGRINVDVLFHETTGSGLASQLRASSASYSLPFTNGTGANQAQLAWSESGSTDGETANELLVQSLSDDRGTVTFSAVKLIYVRNKATTTSLLVTVDNWTALDPVLSPLNAVVPPGGVFVYTNPTATGWTVGASSALGISSQTQGQSAAYEIMLAGEGTT